jgi:hypothetical protein
MDNLEPVSDLRNKFTDIEKALDEADEYAKKNSERMTHEEVFENLRRQLNG